MDARIIPRHGLIVTMIDYIQKIDGRKAYFESMMMPKSISGLNVIERIGIFDEDALLRLKNEEGYPYNLFTQSAYLIVDIVNNTEYDLIKDRYGKFDFGLTKFGKLLYE